MSEHAHGTGGVFGESFWDERYRSAQRVWSDNPNPQLVAEVADRPPGRALDVGSGEGADAIWLARRGWTVVAADISGVALERAAQHARDTDPAAAGRIEWQKVDLLARPPPPAHAGAVLPPGRDRGTARRLVDGQGRRGPSPAGDHSRRCRSHDPRHGPGSHQASRRKPATIRRPGRGPVR